MKKYILVYFTTSGESVIFPGYLGNSVYILCFSVKTVEPVSLYFTVR